MKHSYVKNQKGSLTVEACVAFPLFLCFFLLLAFFIRVACINITLNHAVNETAKQLAAGAYPITFLNELEDEVAGGDADYSIPTYEEELGKIKGYISDSYSTSGLLSGLMTGNLSTETLNNSIAAVMDNINGDFKAAFKGYLLKEFSGNYFDAKTRLKYSAAGWLLNKNCKGSFVNTDSINYLLVELPQGAVEYEIKNENPGYRTIYNELGCTTNPDDVVIAIEYKIDVPIPFFRNREIVSRHIAVERAWLNGSNGVYTERETGGSGDSDGDDDDKDSDEDDSIVYITRFGERYHEIDCPSIKIRQKLRVTLSIAEKEGRTPCEICILKTSKFGRKR